jgi:hypothetical protein
MGILSKLFKHGESAAAVADVQCPHVVLTPRWDRIEDIGKDELSSSYHCESCGVTLTGEEGRRLRGGQSGSTAD